MIDPVPCQSQPLHEDDLLYQDSENLESGRLYNCQKNFSERVAMETAHQLSVYKNI